MAITNLDSYISTIDDFLGHWLDANSALGVAKAITIAVGNMGYDRGGFQSLRSGLLNLQFDLQSKDNDVEIARSLIEFKKTTLLGWINEFNGLVDAYYSDTHFFAARPKVPTMSDGRDTFSRPMMDMATLWEKLNAAPARPGLALPIKMVDNTTQAQFLAAMTTFDNAYQAAQRADQLLTLSRRNRDLQNTLVYTIMKNYRQAVPSLCREFPLIVDTLPRLTPEPGSTPDALTATGIFQAPDIAHIEHSPVTQPGIKRVELRGNLGETYNPDTATLLAQHAPNAPATFNTSHGLTGPDTKLVVKVFVINETDNEAGSNSVVIIRPA